MSFVKLDESILDSSVWCSHEQAIVWVTCLLMARPVSFHRPRRAIELGSTTDAGWEVPAGDYGLIEASASGILNRARIPNNLRAAGYAAITALCAPDPESKTTDFEGRRLARIEGGFVVINFRKYRDKDHSAAKRQADYRKRQKEAQQSLTLGSNGNVTEAEAEAEGEEKKKDLRGFDSEAAFDRFWSLYPKKSGKKNARREWDRLDVDHHLETEILSGLGRYLKSDRVARGYILDPERFLKQRRWEDEPEPAVDRGNGAPPDRLGTLERDEVS